MCNSGQNCAPLGWVEWHEGMCKHVKPWDIRVGSKGTTLLPLSSIGEIEKWLSQQEKSLSLLKSKQVGNELSFEWVIYLHSTMGHCHCTIMVISWEIGHYHLRGNICWFLLARVTTYLTYFGKSAYIYMKYIIDELREWNRYTNGPEPSVVLYLQSKQMTALKGWCDIFLSQWGDSILNNLK